MKAVTITEATKQLGTIGEIYIGNIPKELNRLGDAIIGYDQKTDLQTEDGWKDVIQPALGENEKYGSLIENASDFTYEVVNLTQAELDAKIPQRISKLSFKQTLFQNHGITNAQVESTLDNLLSNQTIDVATREILNLLWNESTFFERNNPNLFAFLSAFSLTEQDVLNIFKVNEAI